MNEVIIHDIQDINKIKNKDRKIYDYFNIFVDKKPIKNLTTEIFFIEINDKIIPCTKNDTEYKNTYINSFYTGFILYSREEVKKTNNKLLIYGFKILSLFFSFLFKMMEINKIVQINNWLLSTNLVIDLNDDEVKAIKYALIKKYPKHVYLMRSITKKLNLNTYNSFEKNNFNFIPTRKVHLYEGTLKNNNIKNDIRLKNKSDLNLRLISKDTILSDKDYEKILDLYNQLYIDKYSKHNPQYNKIFIKNLIEKELIDLYVYERNNIIEAVGGIFFNEKTLTLPLVGYNTKIDINEGLYRLIIIEVLLKFQKENKNLNLSSGAGKFKELRGSKPNNEYAAIYFNHMPIYKIFFWKGLIKVLNSALKIIDKYKL